MFINKHQEFVAYLPRPSARYNTVSIGLFGPEFCAVAVLEETFSKI